MQIIRHTARPPQAAAEIQSIYRLPEFASEEDWSIAQAKVQYYPWRMCGT